MYDSARYIVLFITTVVSAALIVSFVRRDRLNKWTIVAILGFVLMSVSISGSLPNTLRFLHYKRLFSADMLEVVLQNAEPVTVDFSTLFDDGTPRFGSIHYGTRVGDLAHHGPVRIGEVVFRNEGNTIGTMVVWQLTENLHEVPKIGPVYRINSNYFAFSGTNLMNRNVLYAFQDSFFQAIFDFVVLQP